MNIRSMNIYTLKCVAVGVIAIILSLSLGYIYAISSVALTIVLSILAVVALLTMGYLIGTVIMEALSK